MKDIPVLLCLLASQWLVLTEAFLVVVVSRNTRSIVYRRHAALSVEDDNDTTVDVAIVGAGLGGLVAGAILNTIYKKKVGIYESHYLAGGCAHAFDRRVGRGNMVFTFDSGPTILLGCSAQPYNALQQVLTVIDQPVEWIPYDGWGMIESPSSGTSEKRWKVTLGPDAFENGPLQEFGGPTAYREFKELQTLTQELVVGASIPAMAMRGGKSAVLPLLQFWPTLWNIVQTGAEKLTGTFGPYMDGPMYTVTDPWLRHWLDALAFSLSGLPASRTAAAAMGFILNDMHRPGAALDYPRGGMGCIVDALVRGVEQHGHGSRVHLSHHVESIDFDQPATKATGLTLKNGQKIMAREGVICNAPVWSLRNLVQNENALQVLNGNIPLLKEGQQQPPSSWKTTVEGSSIHLVRNQAKSDPTGLLSECDSAEQTGSFLHLHLALDSSGLNLDELEAHYTVMDRSLSGDNTVINGVKDGPCAISNMIAVSNPCKIDPTLAQEGYIVVHAYGAGNEPYKLWENLDRKSAEYKKLKEERAEVLWRAVESIIPDARQRTVLELIGSPLTHERFLRRPRGTYGSATEDYLKDGTTPIQNLVLASDGVFPGIGVPSVAIAGASAANSLVGVLEHWRTLDKLRKSDKLKI